MSKREAQIRINLPIEDEEKLRSAADQMGISLSSLAYVLLWQASYAFSEFKQIGPHNRDKVRTYVRKSVVEEVAA